MCVHTGSGGASEAGSTAGSEGTGGEDSSRSDVKPKKVLKKVQIL